MTDIESTVKALRSRYSLDPTIQGAADLIENLYSDVVFLHQRVDALEQEGATKTQQNVELLKAFGYTTRFYSFPEDSQETLHSVINIMRDCAENAIAKATGGE